MHLALMPYMTMTKSGKLITHYKTLISVMQRSVFSHLEATILYGSLLLSQKAAKEFVRDGLTYLMSRYLTEYKIKHKMLILL
ncbi:Uncharacterised protein [Escherichia coli]|nr:Uncharacterised protein [Escherichia coli]